MSGRGWLAAGLLIALAGGACQSSAGEPWGLDDGPPLDYAVLVTGGAFLQAEAVPGGTFGRPVSPDAAGKPAVDGADAIPMAAIVDVLKQGQVFRRLASDPDLAHRRELRGRLQAGATDPDVQQFLQQARDDGFDLLLVVEELQDGPIEGQGINGRWPVTFVTWILLGVGFLIPDHTFESRATLRVTVRELQTGRILHDPLLDGGPIELSLIERSDLLGLLVSILVPPFWVGDDEETVAAAVRSVVQRRLLLRLARDLKSEAVRQRLRERSAARFVLVDEGQGLQVVVDAAESLSGVRLRREAAELPPEVVVEFERAMLASMRRDGDRFRYQASLPKVAQEGLVQVLVGTIRGNVASATFAPGRSP